MSRLPEKGYPQVHLVQANGDEARPLHKLGAGHKQRGFNQSVNL